MRSEQADALGDEFAAANAEAIAFARSCTESEWGALVPGEEWTVGVVLHHIAESHASALAWLLALAHGEAVSDTGDDIDHRNVDHAARAAEVTVAETVALLEANGDRSEAALRALTEEEMATVAPFGPADGRSFPASEFAGVLARHTRDHLDHARRAVAGDG